MSRTYTRYNCEVCGKRISTAGAGRTAHYRKHVREGKMSEKLIDFNPGLGIYGRYVFTRINVDSDWKKKVSIATRQT